MVGDSASFIGDVPRHYDEGLGPVIFDWYAREMAVRVAETAPANVLETAAGTGIVSRALRDALPRTSRLTVTDLNLPMLEVARTKFAPEETVSIEPADAQHLPYRDSTFDSVVCQFGVMFYPDQRASFQQARRVLQPGGEYHLSLWDSHEHNGFARIADDLSRRLFPDDPPPFYRVPFKDWAIEPIRDELEGAGFTEIDVDVLPHETLVERWESFADGLVYGNPLFDHREQLIEMLSAEYGPAPTSMPIQAIFYRAISS